jgi:hypothetical protein
VLREHQRDAAPVGARLRHRRALGRRGVSAHPAGADLEAARSWPSAFASASRNCRRQQCDDFGRRRGVRRDYDFEATLRTADRRMYEAKAAGRNCVV